MTYKMNRRAFLFAAPLSLAAFAKAHAETDVLAQAFNRLPKSVRLSAQQKLSAGGFYNGRPDGSFGPGTKAALINVASFIKDNSYGKVVFELTSGQDADRFLLALARGELDKYLWGEADESEGG